MKCFILLGCTLFLGLPVFADVSSSPQVPEQATQVAAPETKPEVVQDTPEDKAYKAEMIKMSDAISQKIAQIQAKQKEIDSEVYLASKPPLIADKATLEAELKDLEMARDRMQAQKTAKDLTKQLKNSSSNTPQQ